MKINTQDLLGPALDWAVAKCEGVEYHFINSTGGDYNGNWWHEVRRYSTAWSQGGPIIERERIMVAPAGFDNGFGEKWNATWAGAWPVPHDNWNNQTGPTPLVAAMRCYVASRLGDEVEVPAAAFQPVKDL